MEQASRLHTGSGHTVALMGNPNVGKSTLFNLLTGMRQHTGNWPGKTVAVASGEYRFAGNRYTLIDLPGTYSLSAGSPEEEIARDYLCFGHPEATVVVADATTLERSLHLLLQTLEICPNTLLCVNLMDEAARKGITVDIPRLEQELGIPVVAAAATSGKGEQALCIAIARACKSIPAHPDGRPGDCPVHYGPVIERALALAAQALPKAAGQHGTIENPEPAGQSKTTERPERAEQPEAIEAPPKTGQIGDQERKQSMPPDAPRQRFLCLKLLTGETAFARRYAQENGLALPEAPALREALRLLELSGVSPERLHDRVAERLGKRAQEICAATVSVKPDRRSLRDLTIDRLLTGKRFGIPVMLLLLCLIFWLTISGANYPSALLSRLLFSLGDHLGGWLLSLGAPDWLYGITIMGMYRTLAWVVSVMLPPMAIFFPLFTLLEDLGYLPRIAFNLDHAFCRCGACGKQALTMAMGFGCNAVGVIGCRIISSPRERLIAILTNCFVPCNGRFPLLITMISIFFCGALTFPFNSLCSALLLTGVILLGVLLTLLCSRLLSGTLLRGLPSSFTLELPPYRKPQVLRVIVRSVFDRTLFVLGRAVAVALPAGGILWLMANCTLSGDSLLRHCAGFLDPFARLMGMDGFILLAFILSLPANEMVLPVIIMSYLSAGHMVEMASLQSLRLLLIENGWSLVTACCVMLFSLTHFPCATTLWTMKKETGSLRWTALGFLLPTALGVLLCMLVNALFG